MLLFAFEIPILKAELHVKSTKSVSNDKEYLLTDKTVPRKLFGQ